MTRFRGAHHPCRRIRAVRASGSTRRRLGARVPRLVLVDWIVSEAPPPFRDGLQAMR